MRITVDVYVEYETKPDDGKFYVYHKPSDQRMGYLSFVNTHNIVYNHTSILHLSEKIVTELLVLLRRVNNIDSDTLFSKSKGTFDQYEF